MEEQQEALVRMLIMDMEEPVAVVLLIFVLEQIVYMPA